MKAIANICGVQPEGFEKTDISSDPNFVFKSDANYAATQLFDIEGNTVFVNSYLECQHYVMGGWDYTPLKNAEILLQESLFYVVTTLLVLTFFKNIAARLLIK
jgi:ABC-type antimicrobial peptide transport system permease subunit